jgi:hypothetical protein
MKRNPQFDPDFTNSITVSKLAAAKEHIKAAVRLHLAGDHLVPVFTLAKARPLHRSIGTTKVRISVPRQCS